MHVRQTKGSFGGESINCWWEEGLRRGEGGDAYFQSIQFATLCIYVEYLRVIQIDWRTSEFKLLFTFYFIIAGSGNLGTNGDCDTARDSKTKSVL